MQRVQTMLNEYRNLAQYYYDKLSKEKQDTIPIDTIVEQLLLNDIVQYHKNLFEKAKKDFSVKNFKPFGAKAQKVSKKPITLVYGPNSIGKSSYIRSLLYLQAIKQTGETDIKNSSIFGDEVDFGGFYSCVHKHNLSENIEFEQTSNFGSHVLTLLFGFAPNALKLYKKYKNYHIKLDEENLLRIKGLLYLKLIAIENEQNDEVKFKHLGQNIIAFNFKNEIKEQVTLDYGSVSIRTFLKNYLLHQFLKTFKNFNLENLEKYDIRKNILKFQDELDKVVAELYPIKLFDILSKKIRKFNAKYIISNKNIFKVQYSIDNELFLTLESDLSSIEKETALANENPIKIFNRYVSFIEFHKHSVYTKIFDSNIFKSEFFKKVDLINSMKEYNKNYGATDYYTDPDLAIDVSNDTFEILYKNNIFAVKSPIRIFDIEDIDILVEELTLYGFREYIQKDKKYKSAKEQFFQNILVTMERDFKIESLNYFAPLRFYPDRYFSLENSEGENSSAQNWAKLLKEEILDDFALGMGYIPLKEKLNSWLGDTKLKTPYELEVVTLLNDDMLLSQLEDDKNYTKEDVAKLIKEKLTPIKQIIAFRDKRTNTVVSHKDLGLGISQILPILVSLLNARKNQLIAVEQPELHLHPRLQSELGDEFIKASKDGCEIVVETHSEHLLLRIMKRMRQTHDGTLEDESLKLTPNNVALLYIDSDGDNTYILELELDEDGTLLDPWPGGFFEEGFKERFF